MKFRGVQANSLNQTRAGRDSRCITDGIIARPAGLMGANVEVRLEIQAYVPGGVPDSVGRIVTENGQVLKFENHGFEEE